MGHTRSKVGTHKRPVRRGARHQLPRGQRQNGGGGAEALRAQETTWAQLECVAERRPQRRKRMRRASWGRHMHTVTVWVTDAWLTRGALRAAPAVKHGRRTLPSCSKQGVNGALQYDAGGGAGAHAILARAHATRAGLARGGAHGRALHYFYAPRHCCEHKTAS